MRRLAAYLAFLLAGFCTLSGQNPGVLVSGYVKDASSGEPLIGAVVFTADLSVGVSTDGFGYYSIRTKTSEGIVKCSFSGYKTASIEVRGEKSLRHDFLLEEDLTELEAAKVFSKTKREEIALPQMGRANVDAVLVKKVPAIMGESDLIRVIQMMPGVQTPSEGSVGFSVRGGGVDQNLIIMDGAPLYNSGHFLGFLSMFNGDAVKNAQLYKGDFPAMYGGRLSSVLDISTRDGNNRSFGGNASIGLITSKLFLEGPIVKEKLSFMLSARRTYLDVFFPLFGKKVPKETDLFFYDINARLSYVAGPSDRLYFSVFSGRDVFGMSMEEFQLDHMKFRYANNTQSLRWNHVFSPKVSMVTTLYNARYDDGLSVDMNMADFDYAAMIREMGLKTGITWYAGRYNTVQAGVNLANYHLEPGTVTPSGHSSVVIGIKQASTLAFQPSFYLQNEQKLSSLTVRYGLRFSLFSTYGNCMQRYFDPVTHELDRIEPFGTGKKIIGFSGLEPRISASWSINRDFSLKASYTRSNQYIQLAAVSVSGSPVDTWLTASPNIKPQKSDQFSVGANALFVDQALELSLEAFYKRNRNTMDFVDNAGIVIDNENREGLLRFGKSWSYGTELMLKYEFDKINGWLSYTWSRAKYHIPEINGGEPYRSPLNHEHSVNFVLTYDINRRVSASADWVFYSGAPTTFPVGRFSYGGTYAPIYNKRNTDSMPDYHRLDLSVTYRTKGRASGKRWSGEWNLSLYNAYSRHNAWSIAFNYNVEEDKPEARKVYLFTIVPSVSYNIKF